MIDLGELLRTRRIGNDYDRRAAYSLIGYYAIHGKWTRAQHDMAEMIVARWTDPVNAKRLDEARRKASHHAN